MKVVDGADQEIYEYKCYCCRRKVVKDYFDDNVACPSCFMPMLPLSHPTKVDSLLDQAKKLVMGDRQDTYDHPYDNHKRIAGFWNTYLSDILKEDITPRQVAIMLILLKISREMYKSKRDNGVDIAGYAAVVEMIDEKEEEVRGESSGNWHRP